MAISPGRSFECGGEGKEEKLIDEGKAEEDVEPDGGVGDDAVSAVWFCFSFLETGEVTGETKPRVRKEGAEETQELRDIGERDAGSSVAT